MANPIPDDLAGEWHPTLNGSLTPACLSAGSKAQVWWQRDCRGDAVPHVWRSAVFARTRGNGCAICTNRQVQIGVNDLNTTHPHLAAEWLADRNGRCATEVTAGLRQKVWWRAACGHEWAASPQQRSRSSSGCPACSPSGGRALPGVNDLGTTHPALAAEWHPGNKKSAERVTFSSKYRARWLGRCGHEWVAQVASRGRIGNGCPVCAGQRPEVGVSDLETLRPDLHAELHPSRNVLEDIGVESLAPYSNRKVWWRGTCGHVWLARVMRRSDGVGCPVCANRSVEAGFNDLLTTRPDVAGQWHQSLNGDLTANHVTAGAKLSVHWSCPDGHSWEAPVYSVSAGTGCPTCAHRRSRIELAFLALFQDGFCGTLGSVRVPVRWTSPAGRTYSRAEADIAGAVNGVPFVVEYDGEWHHRKKAATDSAKTRAMLAAGFLVVRIRETPLVDLDISQPSFLQIPHSDGHPLEPTVAAVAEWLTDRALPATPHTWST